MNNKVQLSGEPPLASVTLDSIGNIFILRANGLSAQRALAQLPPRLVGGEPPLALAMVQSGRDNSLLA